MNRKKSDIELELARKCRELRESFEFNEKLGKRVLELEKIINHHDEIIKLHTDELKYTADCFDSNLGITLSINKKVDELEKRIDEIERRLET